MAEPIRILSLGGGVQSVCVARMSLDGELPPLDHMIFADVKSNFGSWLELAIGTVPAWLNSPNTDTLVLWIAGALLVLAGAILLWPPTVSLEWAAERAHRRTRMRGDHPDAWLWHAAQIIQAAKERRASVFGAWPSARIRRRIPRSACQPDALVLMDGRFYLSAGQGYGRLRVSMCGFRSHINYLLNTR